MKTIKFKVVLFGVLLAPLLLLAQQNQNAINAVEANSNIMSQLAHLLPMGINPYATVFLTSILSKLGIHNDFVATNPFFDNWIILILFGVLFLFTASVGTLFKTNKATAVLGLADNYLSNHAAILINIVVMLAPAFFANSGQTAVIQEAGFLSMGLQAMLMILVSVYFLIVVTTVRFFIDILIFLTPIPFIDSILEIVKIVLTGLFIVLSVFFPSLSVILSIMIFMAALAMYKKSLGLVAKTTYLFVYPIVNMVKSKENLLIKNDQFSILVFLNTDTKKLKRSTIARLESREDGFYLVKRRFYLAKKEEKIDFTNSVANLGSLKATIIDDAKNTELFLNRSYRKYHDEILNTIGVKNEAAIETLELNEVKGFIAKVKNMFDKDAVEELKLTD